MNLDNLLGEDYMFEGICDWAKKRNLADVGRMCAHDDCKKAFYYNLRAEHIKEKLENKEFCLICGADFK